MLKSLLAIVLTFALTTLVLAQGTDSTPEATEPAQFPIAGVYSVTNPGGAPLGTLTVTGSGPIYTASIVRPDGATRASIPMLMQGNVGVAPFAESECLPGVLLRQRDGTLFGWWVDSSVRDTALGFEHYTPRGATTDFAGTYDVVGSYANGDQYTGTVAITRTPISTYRLVYTFTTDEQFPQNVPVQSFATGVGDGSSMGYTYTYDAEVACKTIMLTFNEVGDYLGRIDDGSGKLDLDVGSRQPS